MKWLNGYKLRQISLVLVLALGLIASVANADFTFGTPTNLGPPVNSLSCDGSPHISADGLSLFFDSLRPGGYGTWDIWVATRQTTDEDWGTPVNLGPNVNSWSIDAQPNISQNGLSLFFLSNRSGGSGGWDLWMTTRGTTDEDWGAPVNLGETINSSSDDLQPSLSADGLSLYFNSNRPVGYGDLDIWVSTRPTTNDPWGEPVNLGPAVNSSAGEGGPSISADGLLLFFDSDRAGGYGGGDLWMTKRATIQDDWTTPVPLPINTGYADADAALSADGRTLYFFSSRPGGPGNGDLWQAPIIQIVDLNGDGNVDCIDICDMVDNWGTDKSLYDIGPMPWGDGIVDVQDLIVLTEYLTTEVVDPNLAMP